ncbi:hypothetical protein ACFYVR_05955 [Rhodococcus sp. NPDC003318]|uniref:hypothetical protein n=1 Tax=Rhodococcus sp. NPDC003318 TaxID=3364503 RepID=UPI0036B8AADB
MNTNGSGTFTGKSIPVTGGSCGIGVADLPVRSGAHGTIIGRTAGLRGVVAP